MKKFYFLAIAFLATATIQAQTTVDFENLTLPKVDTFYNGADLVGSFTAGGITFPSDYSQQYAMWNGGFAYSNMRNDTTAGFTNAFSAYPAEGANGSTNYAIYMPTFTGDTLFLPYTSTDLSSVSLTNTTYTYLSMKNGDAIGKKFGSSKNASGVTDGTQGKDYLFVTIYGYDENNTIVDSVDFYLADYRFSDTTQNYIVADWTPVDLSAFTGVNYLTFKFHSSDVGQYGINTPTYFAMDNLIYSQNTSSLPINTLPAFTIYPNPANTTISINGATGRVNIYSISGQKVKEINTHPSSSVDISGLEPGIYFVKCENPKQPIQQLIIK